MEETDKDVAAAAPSHFLVDARGSYDEVDRALVREHLEKADFFWLDLHGPSADEIAMLREIFALHPLAVEDAEHYDQRPKLDVYDDFVLLVVYGANEDQDGLVEVDCFLSDRFLITVHYDDCPPFASLRRRAARDHSIIGKSALLLHAVCDALVDSFFPILTGLDDRIDELELHMLARPTEEQLQEVFHLKRRLVGWRKIMTAQRDLFAGIVSGVVELPGLTAETDHYYRDVYDHLIRISDLIDSYRDLLTGSMDLYLSTVSNRLNEVMKRLTIVATIFMPLTWITGFFGMNFAWMIHGVESAWMFLIFGIVTQIAALAVMLMIFRRQGWL